MMRMVREALRWAAVEHGRLGNLYRRMEPSPADWAEYLRRHGGFYAIGEGCHISPRAGLFDRVYVRIGNNVWIEECFIVGHDGTIGMINNAYGVRLDKVGKVDICDNVAIGIGAAILPGVTIGPNAIVGAGSVVGRDVPPNSVVSGVPATVVSTLDEYVANLQQNPSDATTWEAAQDPLRRSA
jgi:acetyltransferase-like isoleucine patch superfamily enzyme